MHFSRVVSYTISSVLSAKMSYGPFPNVMNQVTGAYLPQGWDIDWDDDTFSERKAVFFDNLWREYPPSCRFVPPSA